MYLPLVRLIQNNRFAFETAVGTVAQSKEWGDIYRYLTTFNKDHLVAGDFAGFDTKMVPQVMLAAFDILIELASMAKYDEEDLLMMRGIANDISFPLIDFFGELIQLDGSNPSGHPLTVIINSLVNSLYQRYVYYELNPEHEVESFQDNVKLITYGDDNAMNVKSTCKWYNHTAIARQYDEIGVQYTMAEKEAESIPFIPIEDVSFLKRKWRFEEAVGDYVAPLPLRLLKA